jgi:CRP-like cAMP-binding protein
MPADRKTEQLSQVRMFSALNKKELGTIAKVAETISVTAGSEIVRQGEIGHEFYLIAKGSATVKRGGRKTATLGEGDYFGEMALLDKRPRSATVVADSDCELVVLGQREFMSVLDSVPAVSYKLLVSMAARLREADSRALSH